jgi:hypothetical protein
VKEQAAPAGRAAQPTSTEPRTSNDADPSAYTLMTGQNHFLASALLLRTSPATLLAAGCRDRTFVGYLRDGGALTDLSVEHVHDAVGGHYASVCRSPLQPSGCFAPLTQILNRNQLISTLASAAVENVTSAIKTVANTETEIPARRMVCLSVNQTFLMAWTTDTLNPIGRASWCALAIGKKCISAVADQVAARIVDLSYSALFGAIDRDMRKRK